jgi:hypothetical protein
MEPCTGSVTATISGGTTPTFTWKPSCLVVELLVERDGWDQWFLEATGDGIRPGVRYGTAPAGAIEDEPATPLVRGVTYELILFWGTRQNPRTAAIRRFTP